MSCAAVSGKQHGCKTISSVGHSQLAIAGSIDSARGIFNCHSRPPSATSQKCSNLRGWINSAAHQVVAVMKAAPAQPVCALPLTCRQGPHSCVDAACCKSMAAEQSRTVARIYAKGFSRRRLQRDVKTHAHCQSELGLDGLEQNVSGADLDVQRSGLPCGTCQRSCSP